MRRFLILALGCMLTWPITTAFSAQRVVLYEQFTEDQCLECVPVTQAYEAFRNQVSRDEVAVIAFSVRGEEEVPDGDLRLDFYGESTVPQAIGDGIDHFPSSLDVNTLTSHLNNRKNVASPCIIEVLPISQTQYQVLITGVESAINANLVVVAYEDITHESLHFPCFARQFLTEYFGDQVNIPAGGTYNQTYNINLQSGWNAGNMGVIAFLQRSAKSGPTFFRPHEVIQAADSRASHNSTPTPDPTATPTSPEQPTNTPTPTPDNYTPEPTPTFSQTNLQQDIALNKDMFYPNDQFLLTLHTINPKNETFRVDQYILLEVAGSFFFWPDWSADLDWQTVDYAANFDQVEELFNFTWPDGVGSFNPITFYCGALLPGSATLAGPIDYVTWGYAQ